MRAVVVLLFALASGPAAQAAAPVQQVSVTSGGIGTVLTGARAFGSFKAQVTRDGGATWAPLAVPTGRVRQLLLRPDGSGYAVDRHGRVQTTADGGGSWRATAVTRVSQLSVSGRSAWALRARPGGRVLLSHTVDAGGHWPTRGLADVGRYQSSVEGSLTWLDRARGVLTGVAGSALHPVPVLKVTRDAGRHFTRLQVPCDRDADVTNGRLTARWPTPDALWLVCDGQGAAGSAAKQVWVSADGGRSFSLRSYVPLSGHRSVGRGLDRAGYVADLNALGPQVAVFAAVNAASSGLVQSVDGGRTWTPLTGYPEVTEGRPIGLDATEEERWAALGQAGLWHSQDAGATWTWAALAG